MFNLDAYLVIILALLFVLVAFAVAFIGMTENKKRLYAAGVVGMIISLAAIIFFTLESEVTGGLGLSLSLLFLVISTMTLLSGEIKGNRKRIGLGGGLSLISLVAVGVFIFS